MKPECSQGVGRRLADVSEDKVQVRSDRREFFAQAAVIVVAAAGSLCCGCQSKTSSSVGGDSTRGEPHEPAAQDHGSSSGPGSTESVEQRVIEIVAEQMGIPRERLQRTSRFKEDLGADSLDTVELVMECEEEFDINIPDAAVERLRTVGQAIDFVQRLLGDRPVPPRKPRRKPRSPGQGIGNKAANDLNRRKP